MTSSRPTSSLPKALPILAFLNLGIAVALLALLLVAVLCCVFDFCSGPSGPMTLRRQPDFHS